MNQTAESKSTTPLVRQNNNNVTNNIYPYGNVPLSLLQQQIPADIKVGGGNGNNPANSKRPSFYQWPLVGNFFGSNGRARFKSLGGGGGTGRKYEPQGQLTPPSLQNLQQGNAAGSKESSAISRRPFNRQRNNQQQSMSVEDQTKVEYYLLRQQQLHLQQQQLHQANRLLWGDSNRSQQLTRGQQQGLSFQQYQQLLYQQQQQQQWIPQRQVAPPPPPPPQWRPDALVEAEITRYSINSKPIVQGDLSVPLDHMQQTLAQTMLNPSNQQFIERIRNQQQNVPQIRSSMLLPATELATTPTPLMNSLAVANTTTSTSSSTSTIISSNPVTLKTTTVSNTLPVAISRQVEQLSTTNDDMAVTDMEQSESIQTSYTKAVTEDPVGLPLAAIEAATLLAAKTPSSNRQMNETVQALLPAPSADATATATTSLNSTLDLGDQSSSTNQTDSPSNVTSAPVSTVKEESVLLPLRDNANTAILWSPDSDEPFSSDSGSNTQILMTDELYPDPEQLGQARDEYWSNKALSSVKGTRQINPSSSLAIVVGSTYYPHQYAAIRPSRLQLQEHQPLYIPLNLADRQSRQLQAQYYADTGSVQKHGSEPLVVVSTR